MASMYNDYLGFIKIGKLPQKIENSRCDGLNVLITGATSGVGYSTAKKYASMGANLIIIIRNRDKGTLLIDELQKSYPNGKFSLFIADFENLNEVSNACNGILNSFDSIDLIINNAGIYRTKKKLIDNEIDSVFVVNHLAPLLITNKLLPLLLNSDYKRVLNVNSEGHRFGNVHINDLGFKRHIYSGLLSYGASKSAQLHTMYILINKLSEFNITINCVHPGAVKSNIGSSSGPIYNFYMKYLLSHFLADNSISGSAIYYLGVSEDLEGVSGNFYNLTNYEQPAPHARESEKSLEIYNRSMELIREYL